MISGNGRQLNALDRKRRCIPGTVLSWRYAGVHVSVAGFCESSTTHDQGTSCSVTCSETQAEGSCTLAHMVGQSSTSEALAGKNHCLHTHQVYEPLCVRRRACLSLTICASESRQVRAGSGLTMSDSSKLEAVQKPEKRPFTSCSAWQHHQGETTTL